MACSHNFLPVAASKQKTRKRTSSGFLPAMAVQNTRPAATVGEPMPSPSFADQRTLFGHENSAGKCCLDRQTPVQLGPRNCGQSSACKPEPANPNKTTNNRVRVVIC